MINKKEYTLHLLQISEDLFKKVRIFVEKNSDILEFTKDVPFELIIEDKSKYSDFKLSISKPKQDSSNRVLFETEYKPFNRVSLKTHKTNAPLESVMKILMEWTDIIRSYNNIKLTPDESILNEYEKEFFENFELIDEDADTHPFKLDKQVIIHNYFANIINILENNENEYEELINEAIEIKDSIPNMTKRATVRKMSGFFAKVRKKSLSLLKELLDVGKKEIFKKAVKLLIDSTSEITSLI